jgi:hypothetical protein
MISKQARQYGNELDLSEFRAGAILWAVGPGEERALRGSNDYL